MTDLTRNPLLEEEFFQTGKVDKVYPKSYTEEGDTSFVMFKKDAQKFLYVKGSGDLFTELNGTEEGADVKIVPCDHENRLVLNKFFAYTKPQAFGNKVTTMGVGDRLGLASP